MVLKRRGVGLIKWYSTPSPNLSPYIFLGLDPSPPPLIQKSIAFHKWNAFHKLYTSTVTSYTHVLSQVIHKYCHKLCTRACIGCWISQVKCISLVMHKYCHKLYTSAVTSYAHVLWQVLHRCMCRLLIAQVMHKYCDKLSEQSITQYITLQHTVIHCNTDKFCTSTVTSAAHVHV